MQNPLRDFGFKRRDYTNLDKNNSLLILFKKKKIIGVNKL